MSEIRGGWISRDEMVEKDLNTGVNPFECLDHSELVKEEYLQEYENKLEFFIEKIIYLNMDLYIMSKVINYPFELLGNGYWFFLQVSNNFYNVDILTICKLLSDTDSDAYTIEKFKGEIYNKFVKENYKDDFRKYVNNHNFKKLKKDIEKKIKDKMKYIRNKSIAHTDKEIFKSIKMYYPKYKEIRDICDNLNILIETLDFGAKIQFLPDEYMHGKGDIENILCLLAKDSTIFKELEKYPERKQILDDENRAKLNIYREKFNLEKL